MPRPSGRGGARQGTPGKTGYSNRTDLILNRAPSTGENTPASGGVQPAPAAPPGAGGWISPDAVTPLDAPTARPHEPVTAGLPIGPGPGPESLATAPSDPNIQTIQAAYLRNPTPELQRALYYLMSQGAL